MDRVIGGLRRGSGWAFLAALIPAMSLAQQNPGLSARPSGQTLEGPSAKEQLIDLSRPERQQTSLTPTTAESEYFEAAMRGEAWAQTKLGKAHVASTDDPLRLQQGVRLLQQAAEQGEPEALFLLGSLAMSGHGVPRSTQAAFDYCRRAAELNYAEAQYELAAMYALGRGTDVDNVKALEWGRKAIGQGNTKAKYSVGRLLLIGEKETDQKEALDLLNQATDAGIDEAGMFLAEAYAAGRHGLIKDETKSIEILEKLSARGNAKAAEVIGRMRSGEE